MSATASHSTPAPTAAPCATPAAGEAVLLETFNQLRQELVGTLVYLLGNRDDAQDAAQETFIKCWKTRASLDGVANLRAFIFRVALNTATDFRRNAWRRKARQLPEGDMLMTTAQPAPPSVLEDQEDVTRLRAALHTLRTEEKEVFLLRQNGELTYEQIAELRHVPVGTVKTQMRSALQKLRKLLT